MYYLKSFAPIVFPALYWLVSLSFGALQCGSRERNTSHSNRVRNRIRNRGWLWPTKPLETLIPVAHEGEP